MTGSTIGKIGWALLAMCIAAAPTRAQQAGWKPERAVELVVGTGPGSSPDRVARLIQKIWQDNHALDVPLSVVNKPGGNNSIGWSYLNQQGDSGHHLMIGVVNLSLGYLTGATQLSYRDITPVSLLFHEYAALIVREDAVHRDLREFVELLKKDPTAASVGVSTAVGGANHLAAALALSGAGVDVKKMRTVAFSSGGKSVTALLGGHVDAISVSPSVAIPLIANKQARAIAVMSPKRLGGVYANVPTFRDIGVDGHLSKYRAVIGPRAMKPEQVAYWEARLRTLSSNPDWKKVLDDNEWDGEYMDARDLAAFMAETHRHVERALADLGMAKKTVTAR